MPPPCSPPLPNPCCHYLSTASLREARGRERIKQGGSTQPREQARKRKGEREGRRGGWNALANQLQLHPSHHPCWQPLPPSPMLPGSDAAKNGSPSPILSACAQCSLCSVSCTHNCSVSCTHNCSVSCTLGSIMMAQVDGKGIVSPWISNDVQFSMSLVLSSNR